MSQPTTLVNGLKRKKMGGLHTYNHARFGCISQRERERGWRPTKRNSDEREQHYLSATGRILIHSKFNLACNMAEDEVTLYGYWRSSCSWRVRIGKLRLRRFCWDARGLHRTHTPPPPPVPPVPCLQPIEEKWDRSYLTACYIAHDVVQNVWPAAPSVYRDVRAAGVQRAASRCTAGIERNLNDTSSVLFFFF